MRMGMGTIRVTNERVTCAHYASACVCARPGPHPSRRTAASTNIYLNHATLHPNRNPIPKILGEKNRNPDSLWHEQKICYSLIVRRGKSVRQEKNQFVKETETARNKGTQWSSSPLRGSAVTLYYVTLSNNKKVALNKRATCIYTLFDKPL